MHTATSPYLFVYSSLRRGFNSSSYAYLSQHFEFVGEAHVRGRLLENVNHPVGVPTTEDFFIAGELYRLRDGIPFDYIMEQLDDYEGVNTDEDNTAPLYRRELVLANSAGENYEAWVYWFNGDTTPLAPLNENDVLEYFRKRNG